MLEFTLKKYEYFSLNFIKENTWYLLLMSNFSLFTNVRECKNANSMFAAFALYHLKN